MVDKAEEDGKRSHAVDGRVEVTSWCSKREPEAAILERKRESGVPLFCVPRQRRSSQPENVSPPLCFPNVREAIFHEARSTFRNDRPRRR